MRALEPGETTLAVHEWGPAEGPPILFWHALGPDQSGAALGDVADRLALAGFRVVAVDGPGFGDSPLLPAESYALDELGALAHRVVRALDLEPLIVMGHSWGGAVMVRYAA